MITKTRVFVISIGVLLMGTLLVLTVQSTFSWLLNDSHFPIVAHKEGMSQDETKRIVNEIFTSAKLTPPQMGEQNRTQEPYTDVIEVFQQLKAANVEVYIMEKPQRTTWRIYNKSGLQYQLHWTKARTTTSSRPTIAPIITTTNTQKVALVITGTHYKNLRPLIHLETPLNFAIEPTSPFGLRNAVEGARHWHEIVLDIRKATTFEFDSLPFATSVLTEMTIPQSNLQPIIENTTLPISLDALPTDDTKHIWILDISTHTVQEVAQWVQNLPTTITLVHLSHWDIAPTH